MRFYDFLDGAVYKVNTTFIDNMFRDLEKQITKKMWLFKGRKLTLLNKKFKDFNINFVLYPLKQNDNDSGIIGGVCHYNEKTIDVDVTKRFLENLNDKKNWPELKKILLDTIEHELIHMKQHLDNFFKPDDILFKGFDDSEETKYREYLSDRAEIMTHANEIAKEFREFGKQHNEDPLVLFKKVWNNIKDYDAKNDFPTLFNYHIAFKNKDGKIRRQLYDYVIEYL